MYRPTTRVLAVLELLQSYPRLTGADLAARLEVDTRSIRRYVATLQDLGIPVEGDAGRFGGYRLRPGFKLPPLMFSEDEVLAVGVGLLSVRHLGLGETAPAVERALAKLDRVLPSPLRHQVRAIQAGLAFSPIGGPAALTDGKLVLALSSAAREGRRVWLRHRTWDGEETRREVDPYGLVYHRGRWYLAGWCHLRDDRRLFRVDCVLEVLPREDRFARPPDFDAVAFVLDSLARLPFGQEVEVLLHTTLEQARRAVPEDLAVLEETSDGVLMRLETDDFEWTARTLVGLGRRFTVIRPPELRDALRRLGNELTAMAAAERAGTVLSPGSRYDSGPCA